MIRRTRYWAILVAAVTIGFIVGYRTLGEGLAAYVIVGLVPLVDAVDLSVRLYLRRVQTVWRDEDGRGSSVPLDVGEFSPFEMKLHMRPYAIVVSVYNVEGRLDPFLSVIAPYQERVWIIDDGSTDNTCRYLERAGVRCVRSETNRKKPGAIRALLDELPDEIETVLVVDPDVGLLDRNKAGIGDLERVIFEFQRSRLAAVCPRVVMVGEGLLARLQKIEYTICCSIGRKSLAEYSVTSGVSIYRRDALKAALDGHSLSVYAEDFENALVLLARGERIYYDDRLTIATYGPMRWSEWFSQRVGWSFGLLKVYSERVVELSRRLELRGLVLYHYFVYVGVFGLLLHPLKIVSLALIAASFAAAILSTLGFEGMAAALPAGPAAFILAYLQYTFLILLALGLSDPGEERWRLLPTVPFYFFYVLALLIPVSVGYANWLSLRILKRRVYRDHYQDESSLVLELGGLARLRRKERVTP